MHPVRTVTLGLALVAAGCTIVGQPSGGGATGSTAEQDYQRCVNDAPRGKWTSAAQEQAIQDRCHQQVYGTKPVPAKNKKKKKKPVPVPVPLPRE